MITAELEFVHKDPRRRIREASSDEGGFSVQWFDEVEVQSGPLGKHAHGEKEETFVILRGGGYLLHALLDKKGNVVGEATRTPLHAGIVIHLKPNEGHTFYLDPEAEMICFSNKPFDKDDVIHNDNLAVENFPGLAT
ncbi:MAG: hypothetical protein HY093_03775 [Candidatus Liptonbacteria bacterium]|nr:hypothetical protein [Candidatus Liptonbacteria bacterium]